MPIDADRFEGGDQEGSIESRILDVLYDHPDTAYNSREIACEVMDGDVSVIGDEPSASDRALKSEFLDIAAVTSILDGLVDDRHVDRRVVGVGQVDRSYYSAPAAVDDPGR